jgi:hypothetical protein
MTDPEPLRTSQERTVTLSLPVSVGRIVEQELEWAAQLQNPEQELLRKYREWEDGTNPDFGAWGKWHTTCFDGCYGDPTLLYWTLEHFSDADFPLAAAQKDDLIFHTFQEAESVRSSYVDDLMSTETSDSLEYCWYFLVRLLLIEDRLTAEADLSDSGILEHFDLVHLHCGLLFRELTQFHELGWITTASPKTDFESRLIELARRHARLQPLVRRLIQDWERLEAKAEAVEHLLERRSDRLRETSQNRDENDEAPVTGLAGQLRREAQVMRQLRSLERIMTPETDDDPAWLHPLEFVEHFSQGRSVIFLKPALQPPQGENLSNGLKFQLALMGRMAEHGFRHWLYTVTEEHLYAIRAWLKENGDSRALKAVVDALEQYLSLARGNRVPALRDFLMLPDRCEPLAVTQELRYWTEVWGLKEQAGAEVRLFMVEHRNESTKAMAWMKAGSNKRFFVVGDCSAFQGYCFNSGSAARDASLILHHRPATMEYECDPEQFRLYRAFHFAAHQVGSKAGWGPLRSSALPIRDNQPFLNAFESGDLQNASTALWAQFLVTTSGGFADGVIFTAEDEHEGNDEPLSPCETTEVSGPTATRF